MKKIALTIVTASAFIYSCSNSPKSVVAKTAHIYGNCDKCKVRIEKAAALNGVTEINWHIDSKLLNCKVDTTATSLNTVLKAIAAAGYDNDAYQGDDYAYNKLPQSCQYERKTE